MKCLDGDGIIKIRDKVRVELAAKFETAENNDHKGWFFGTSLDPKQFDFNNGDSDLIKQMVKQVKSIVDHPKENANTGYFKNEKNAKQKNKVIQTRLYETALGMAYGFESEIKQNLIKAIDTKDLIEILFHKANIEMEKYEDEDFKAKRALTKEMIKVFDVNDVAGTAEGFIFCCFCEDESYGIVKVFCKSINSISWTLSNYKTHMNRQHEEQYKRAEERLQANGPVKKRKMTKPNNAPKSDQIQLQQELEQIISIQFQIKLTR